MCSHSLFLKGSGSHIADISSLNLNPAQPVDWDHYKVGGGWQRPPREGKYFAQLPSTVKVVAGNQGEKDAIVLTANAEGILTGIVDGTKIINSPVEGANGYNLGRTWISTKKHPKAERTSMANYLIANGVDVVGQMRGVEAARANQVYANLVEQTGGRIVEVTTQLEARCPDCDDKGSQLEGEAKFPRNEDGSIQVIVPCKHCKKDMFGALRIRTFVAKSVTAGTAPASQNQPAYA